MFDDSLDLGGSSTQHNSILGTNGQSVELRSRRSSGQSSRSIRRQTWNRDDVRPCFNFKYNVVLNIWPAMYHTANLDFEFDVLLCIRK